MSKKRIGGRAMLVVAVLLLLVPGLWVYMSVTAKKVHPDSSNIPSVMGFRPIAMWTGAADQVRQMVRRNLSESNLAGLSAAVGMDGEIVWAEGFGFADVESGLPVTPSHRFRTGTASTVLTSAALGLLLDEGKLKLDDEIQKYVPDFPLKQWPVTVGQAMGNVAGFQGEDPDDGVLTSSHCERPADGVALFAKTPLQSQPETAYRFSTFGWVLLRDIVETVADTPFVTFLEDRILHPLGMPDTSKESVTSAPPDAATSYNPRFAGNPIYGLTPLPKFDYSCHAGSSGFFSTPSDLVRFGMAVQSGKLLRPETVRRLQTPQRLTSGKETGYGLGWEIKTVTVAGQQSRVAGHSGDFWAGEVATPLTFPERGMAVAVMSNVSAADTSSLAERIAQAFAAQ